MRAPSYAFGLLGRLSHHPPGSELQDVLENIEHVLNTKKDYGSFLKHFGLEVTDWMWAANPMSALGDHMLETIVAYEPRLRDPSIVVLDRDEENCPVFRLQGTVGGSVVKLRIWLHTPHCHVRLERKADV